MKITDNFLNFVDNLTAIPGKVVGGVSDFAGAALSEIIGFMGIPQKLINSGIGITETLVNTPLLLVNSVGGTISNVTSDVVKTTDNAARISDSIEGMLSSPTAIMIAGIFLLKSFTL